MRSAKQNYFYFTEVIMCLAKYIQYEVYLTKHGKIQIYKMRQIPDKLGHDTFLFVILWLSCHSVLCSL